MTTCLHLVSYIISICLFVASGSLLAIGILIFDINSILPIYSECHVHVVSAYGFNYGRILFPVVLSTLEYINNGTTSLLQMKSVSPFVKETCVAHIILGNFPLDLKHIVRNGIVNRFQLTWKLEYYWRGFDKWPNDVSKEFYYKEASSKVYLNIVTEDVIGWKNWMHILHNARWPVFHKVIYHFLLTNRELIRAIVCHNCNKGSSTLVVIEDSLLTTMSSLDLVFNSVQIHKSNGLPLLTYETLRGLNINKLPMSLIPEPEDLLLNSANIEEESDDWQLYMLFAKLVYRGCANATLNALAITKAPDVYSFIQ
jgi:hypothetical protein